MTRKRPERDDVESSSEDEEEEDNVSGGEEDDFISEDDRVNIIPGQDTERIPSESPKASAEDESSSESDDEDDSMKEPAMDVVQGISSRPSEAPPPLLKKLQETRVLENRASSEEGAQKGKGKPAKQQEKDPPPLRSAKGEVLKNVQEESRSGRKVIKDIVSDDSVRDDKKSGISSKKRKNESSQQDAERDSADSEPILKKRKDGDMAQDGEKSTTKDKGSQIPSDSRIGDLSSSKKGVDRDKPLHTLGDVAKEIAKKTLNSTSARANWLKDVFNSRKSPTKQEKKANSSAASRPSSTLKQKRWSVDEEIIVASEVLNRVKMGFKVPSKKTDDFWFMLSEVLQEKLGVEFSRDQLSEKARRMRQKYQGTVQKIKESQGSMKPFKHRNDSEQQLFDIFRQIWGRAEVSNLEDQQGANNGTRKSIQSPDREVKEMHVSSPKARPSSKANAGKIDTAAMTGNDVDVKANAVVATLMKPDHEEEVVKEDQARTILHPLANASTSPINNVDKLLQDRIDATLQELQEWSKQNLKKWMNKASALIEDSTKRLEDQMWRHTSWMGMAGGRLPTMRFCTGMDIQLGEGDGSYMQQLHELHLQEVNVYAQRLELMRKECELKKKQIKAQLHQVQKQKNRANAKASRGLCCPKEIEQMQRVQIKALDALRCTIGALHWCLHKRWRIFEGGSLYIVFPLLRREKGDLHQVCWISSYVTLEKSL
ncbi:hypothetical protein GOP47_0021433 [Adiantum capillus-veneris]|uniref:Glabrous enhancer-binding protein-like DBD domain-containing protein n=1 Tax=Adiantum capillus-veneris TaxID=13818 RepID=A0A9D4U7E2_ADICA|nr:hypothetical protein GOP47_0021433 [Adiantum capillus-veneris]